MELIQENQNVVIIIAVIIGVIVFLALLQKYLKKRRFTKLWNNMEEAKDKLEESWDKGKCFFCDSDYEVDELLKNAHHVPLKGTIDFKYKKWQSGDTEYEEYKEEYLISSLDIPRCPHCKEYHQKIVSSKRLITCIISLSIAMPLLLLFLLFSIEEPRFLILSIIILFIAIGGIVLLCRKRRELKGDINSLFLKYNCEKLKKIKEYEPLKLLVKGGWRIAI